MNNLFPKTEDGNQMLFEKLFTLLGETTGALFFLWDLVKGEGFVSPSLAEKFVLDTTFVSDMRKLLGRVVFLPDRPLLEKYLADIDKDARKDFGIECRLVDKYEKKIWVNITCRILRQDGQKASYIVGNIAEVDNGTRTDPLTGLLNQAQMGADYSNGFGSDQSGYLVIFGIDDFKAVNDRHGRELGNQLLETFGAALQRCVAGGGRVYRLDGDRFSAVLQDKNRVAVGRLYTTVKTELQEKSKLLREGLFCTISAGAASFPYDSHDLPQLAQFADSALNTAKRTGKDALVFFLREEYEQYLVNISMREDIQRSLKNGFEGFELYYQPQISMHSGQVEGAEALLRWNSKEHGRIPPVVFIPLLEKYGLICQVGRWVIEKALAQCRQWRQHLPNFCMSINLSYIQLEKDDIAGFLLSCLRQYELPGEAVLLELTESEQLHNYHYYNETLSYLNRIGVMVAIDDFGTGYSSLGYFKELHINQIKIDRCFVTRIRESEYDYKLIQFIIELAHGVGVTVCVEGVETAEELEALRPLAPDFVQGFHFGRPEPAAIFEKNCLEAWDVATVLQPAQTPPQAGENKNDTGTTPKIESVPEPAISRDALSELAVHKTIVNCIRALIGEESLEGAIQAVLRSIATFYDADRAFIFEMGDEEVASNTYEWCRPGAPSRLEAFQALETEKAIPHWLASLQKGATVVVEEIEQIPSEYKKEKQLLQGIGLASLILVPLASHGKMTGFVGVDNPRHDTQQTSLLTSLAYFITNEIAKRKMAEQLYHLSYRDSLTGVFNHNRYLEDIESEDLLALNSLGVVFVDINSLKELNDTKGHGHGDGLIQQVAGDLRCGFEPYDIYRIGGDEFVVLCRNISKTGIEERLEKLRKIIDTRSYSISIGSTWQNGNIDPLKLTNQADRIMYSHKNEFYREEQRREYARQQQKKKEK